MNRNIARLAAACVLAATGQASHADTLVYNLDQYFNGSPATPAHITATFQDLAGGGVSLAIKANASLAPNSIMEMYFNLDPAFNPGSLIFATPLSPQVATSSIQTATNAYKADGDGYFDLKLSYPTNAFVTPLAAAYKITGIPGLNVSSFIYGSAPGPGVGNSGPFYVAGHTGSGWLAANPTVTLAAPIPEPEIYAMMLAGFALMGFVARRRKRGLSAA